MGSGWTNLADRCALDGAARLNCNPNCNPALRSRSSARGPAPDQLVWLSAGYRVLRRPEEVTMARANDKPMSAAR
jgi:hypothetical protein